MDELQDDDRPLMTRKGLVRHINEKLGIPLKPSSFAKLQMHKESRLEPDAFYGRAELFKPRRGEQWALRRLATKTPTSLDME
jgi:hypothetical protein